MATGEAVTRERIGLRDWRNHRTHVERPGRGGKEAIQRQLRHGEGTSQFSGTVSLLSVT